MRRTALGAVLTALLALLVPIGGTAAAAATDHQTASVCISTSHDDPQDIAQLDGRHYSLSFDCSTRVWTFDVLTTDQWVAHDLNRGDVFLDTDDDPSTGCKGADYAVEALGSNSGIFASVYRTPDCSHQSSVATASASHPAGDELKVTFDDSSVTSPRMFGWYADLVSSAGTDQLPDNSYWVECQPDIAGTRSMAHVHFVHDLPNDFNATRQWDLALVGAPAAWSVTHGSADVAVAILDTGVDATHPDLAGKLVPGYDALHDQPLPAGDTDLEGHGTSTAGVVAAATDNGSGLASLGWNTKVMPVRVGRSCGEIDELAEIRGLHWAVDHGARVINLSFGSPDSDSFEAAAISYAQSHGAVVVASSGNESSSVPDYPAAYNGVFGVGAVGFNGLHASYSNVGSDVALVAPGGSADGNPAHDIAVLAEGGGTRSEAGTSFSSPEVAAAAALVLAVNPALTSGDVASLLQRTAADRGAAGFDSVYGAGLLDAGSAAAGAVTAVPSTAEGYWSVASDGGIFAYGMAPFLGSTGSFHLAQPIVGMAGTPKDDGYWLVASDGGIFAFGNAPFEGSTGAIHLARPVVGMAATPTGKGYWLVASDGGIFAFGDAGFFGSTGAIHLNQPIVGLAATPTGKGYWLVASDGGIFAFGDAGFFGSTGAIHLNQPIVGLAATPTGKGYWLVASDGGIFAFGDAGFFGSTGGISLNQPIVGMAASRSGAGYWLLASDGGIFAFGDAVFRGSAGGVKLNRPMVGLAAL